MGARKRENLAISGSVLKYYLRLPKKEEAILYLTYLIRKGKKLTYEVLIMDKFTWHDVSGRLYFSRYFDNNPALVFKTDQDVPITTCTVNIPEFFLEYPFGDNKLIAVKNSGENEGILESLIEAGIVDSVFTIQDVLDKEDIRVCELTEPVVDLLKSYGEYYV